ncbi:MAG: HAMP domain-containing sensor histidine kinase [Bacillota bacterium]|nr:HAMP domain-containing sensor histidine kinase [Bacillota bacterium]
MKLKWKIYFLCLIIYVMSIVLTAVVVTSSSYNSLLGREKDRSLDEETSIRNGVSMYLTYNVTTPLEELARMDYHAKLLTALYSSDNIYIQIYSKEGSLLSSGFPHDYTNSKTDMDKLTSRSFVLSRLNGSHYLSINDKVNYEGGYIILTTIKDVTYIDTQRNNMYLSFLKTSAAGLIIMSFLVVILGGYITNPIEYLTAAARKISSGNYKDRVTIASKDEIGVLSRQFNQMAEEIENKIEELEVEAQNKQDFIDNLTHELRTPLTSIIGYSELLIGIKYDEDSFNKGLGFINSEGKRILSMVNTLMELILARVNSINPVPCSIESLILSASKSIGLKAEQKNIRIICHGEDFAAAVDEELFKMALINLLDNAIKASQPEGAIEVEYSQGGLEGRVTVKDNGCGISAEHLQKILEPFYRVDKSRSKREGGLGLGLTLVKSIIVSHCGTMDIKSEPGKGTSVTVSIPLKEVN